MKIIFLDIDGVLNSANDKFSQKLETKKHLNLLEKLVKKTNAKIVLSSSWRGIPSLRKIVENKMQEIDAEIIDATRSLPGTRGSEIKDWMKDKDIESFVILDDDSDMDEMTETNLVLTDSNKGLQKEDIEKALKILNRKEDK